MSRNQGFTLLELIVVVLILGILAAVAAPKILSNTSDASDSGASQTLATLRDAIEMYRVQTGTGYPQGDSDQIQTKLDAYLRGSTFPRVSIGGIDSSNDVLIDSDETPTVNTSGGEGWVYSPRTGEIKINSDAELASQPGSGIKYSDL
jgi:prepilin-type N-terminal cleavage/methylation domain-containing protein